MRLALLILLIAVNAFAGGGPPPPWQPWYLPNCQFAWSGTYGVDGNFTNRDQSAGLKSMMATSHQPSQVVNFQNGQPIVRYTNNTMWLTNSSGFFTWTNNNTLIIVAKITGASETTNIDIFLANSGTTNRQAFKINSTAIPTIYDGIITNTGTTWSNMTLNWFCASIVNSNGTVFYRTNGVHSSVGTGGAPTNMVVNAIGNVLNPNIFMTCDFGLEIGFEPGIQATQSLTNCEKWASTWYKLGF